MGKMRIEYDEAGNPYVPDSEVQKLTAGYGAAIETLQNQNRTLAGILQQMGHERQSQSNSDAAIQEVIGSKQGYDKAHTKLQNARAFINQKVTELQEQAGVEGYFTAAQVIGMLDNELSDMVKEFEQAYPNIDIERVIRSYESQRDLRTALDSIGGQMGVLAPEPNPVTQVVDQVFTKHTPADLVDELSDGDVDKLDEALATQEDGDESLNDRQIF